LLLFGGHHKDPIPIGRRGIFDEVITPFYVELRGTIIRDNLKALLEVGLGFSKGATSIEIQTLVIIFEEFHFFW